MYGDSGTDKNYILSLNFQTLSFMLYHWNDVKMGQDVEFKHPFSWGITDTQEKWTGNIVDWYNWCTNKTTNIEPEKQRFEWFGF